MGGIQYEFEVTSLTTSEGQSILWTQAKSQYLRSFVVWVFFQKLRKAGKKKRRKRGKKGRREDKREIRKEEERERKKKKERKKEGKKS